MALGGAPNFQSNQGNNQQKMYEANYYSRLRIKNYSENLALNFRFWSGVLIVAISESGSAQEGRNNDLSVIYFSPSKAKLFANCIQKVIDNPESSEVYGIDTGSGETRNFMAIGREMGVPFAVIAKVDTNGKYESKYRFNFNNDFNYFLKVRDLTNLKCQKEFDNTLELCQFRDILEDFARSSSGAYAYSVHDIGKYEAAKTNNLIRRIAEKTGAVDPNSRYGNGGNRPGNSFFNSSNTEYVDPSKAPKKTSTKYNDLDELELD